MESRHLWRETAEFRGKAHSSAALINLPTPLQQYQSGLAKQQLLPDLQRTTAPVGTGVPMNCSAMQAICDWVHEHIRFDFKAVTPEKIASDTLRDRAGD